MTENRFRSLENCPSSPATMQAKQKDSVHARSCSTDHPPFPNNTIIIVAEITIRLKKTIMEI